MKKGLVVVLLFFAVRAESQSVLDVIKAGVTKAIKAVDLKIQRLQNKVIALQNAQKVIENTMSKLRLTEIGEWVEKQRQLYDDYFAELWKVKAALSYYHRVKSVVERQVSIVQEYRTAWLIFRQDKNFTTEELDYMQAVYSGMFDESVKTVDKLFLVVNAFMTQMSDAKRLEIINAVADELEELETDLKQFNNQNKMVSLQRAVERGEIETVKRLYFK